MQGGDHGEHPLLLAPFQVGLEAHQIVDGAVGVVTPQLHHGVGLTAGLGIHQAAGLQGTEAQGVLAPAGHDLHRHTALEHAAVLKAVDLGLLRLHQLRPEGLIFLFGHGAVDVVRGALIVAGGEIRTVHVHAVEGHQRGRRVKEVQRMAAAQLFRNGIRQRVRGQRAAGDDHIPLRYSGHLAGDHGDIGVAQHGLGDHAGKALPVHRQRTAGGHRGGSDCPAAAAPLSAGPRRFPAPRPAGNWSSTAPQNSRSHGRGSSSPASSPAAPRGCPAGPAARHIRTRPGPRRSQLRFPFILPLSSWFS